MLSDAKVKTLKPKEKSYRILDAERLYIEVRPTGKKIWRFKFTHNSKEGTVSFGEYPAVTLQGARKLKEDAQIKLAKGLNPAQEKKREKIEKITSANNTFEAIAKEYALEQMKYKSEDYIQKFKDCLKRDVYGIIGHMPINEISSVDILNVMKSTVQRIRAKETYATGEHAANLNRRFIGLVIRYAILTSRAENDPTHAVRNVVETPETEHARPLEKQEKRDFRIKIDNYGGAMTVRNAGLALFYSMLRTVEIRKMEWGFVDFDDRLITFPKASRRQNQERSMKMNRTHLVPISNQLYNLLQQQFLITGGQKYVFSSPQKRDCMLSRTTLNKMLEYMGLANVTAHDFRATASTSLYEKGYEEAWVERQLAHAESNKTKASYDHSKHLQQRRKMMQDWADIVDGWRDL
ncbi:tyrosine-type recombinase/integrase [Acinetobacter gerneri]|uniref:tyrosine-type recombinase/integrase n=1 Tax=Acinetobacter gerneri TaxID=202952 RepID=UPI0023F1599F|nr:integrase arm-type DNA-binding domain-containing protein [Acinetobacter gerneri]MCH4243771.1 tyrosine-type recombinase/integrase [Acinetobacter gerneri]